MTGRVGPDSVQSRDSHRRLPPTLEAALFTAAKRRLGGPSVPPCTNGQTRGGLGVDRTSLGREKAGDAGTGHSARAPGSHRGTHTRARGCRVPVQPAAVTGLLCPGPSSSGNRHREGRGRGWGVTPWLFPMGLEFLFGTTREFWKRWWLHSRAMCLGSLCGALRNDDWGEV